jgi:hypothetical protein
MARNFTVANAANRPLFDKPGTLPDVSGAMQDYYEPMTFEQVTKTTVGFQVKESATPITFRGMIQPFTERQLFLKPEGQRAWTWFLLYADPSLSLNVDDIIVWEGVQTRVMGRKDYALYGYMEYHLVQDWTGAGP